MPGYFGSDLSGNIYVIDNDTVKHLSGGNGKVLNKSKVDVDGTFYSTISVDGEGKVYVCNNNYGAAGKMFCFSPDLQTVIWELAVIDLIYCGPSLAKDGTLVIIGSGTQINAYKPNKPLRPVADFTTDSTIVFSGTGLNFYDQSSYLPTSWQWSFPGGTPSSSTEQNPLNIIYSTEGEYEVTLIAANPLGADTLIKKCYLSVVLPVSVEYENIIDNDFLLEQNYPNPFNPSTTIRYTIPNVISIPIYRERNLNVTLKVYDVLGNEVSTLVNEEKPAGSYEVEFKSSVGSYQLANGVYFYRLQAGEFVETMKMTLIK